MFSKYVNLEECQFLPYEITNPMQLIIQRVKKADVIVNNSIFSSIKAGLLIYVGFHKADTINVVQQAIKKIKPFPVFDDRAISDNNHIMLISNFRLYAKVKGNRINYHDSMDKSKAEELFKLMVADMRKLHFLVAKGSFGTQSQIECIVDGPFNILYEISEKI